MAKKVRKPRSADPRTFSQAGAMPARPTSDSPAPAARPLQRPARPAASAQSQPSRQARTVDLRTEYPYVQRDLSKLLLVAAAMFAVLIALNLVLNVVR